MPYTPPSHRSPASSASASPDVSRRSSFQSGNRPSLPRSSSYLKKHRRTPSVTGISDGSASPLTPQGTEEDLPAMAASAAAVSNPSIRKSPPPANGAQPMPVGAVISPPESASSGSDDEAQPEIRGRKADRLKDLRAAVSGISQNRSSSPAHRTDLKLSVPEDDMSSLRVSFSTSALNDICGRKISHVRSATEPKATISKSADNSLTGSDEDTDEDLAKKPQMVRKKSGELVRPALRPSSRRRPSSMPGTPVFSKAVHFDSHLEHVRHFLQVDRPLAVSAGSSPADNYESDTEYPFQSEERSGTRSPPYEWDILTTAFPHDSQHRKLLPVKMERVWLSTDQKSLMGSVAVANLAFHKNVVCRFTLDYWKTTSEIVAEYSHEIRPKETPTGNDRFTFNIKLSDTANLESKTLFFCVRYTVNGQEFWDNNSSANFQVDFRKKHLPQNGKKNFQGASARPANGLPRSNRRQSPSAAPRPKSMPVSFNDFGNDGQFKFDQPLHEYLGEPPSTGLRLKSKSNSNLASDNIVKGLTSPSGVAFANRYDFGASLSAAVQAARDSMGREKDKDALYMKEVPRGQYMMPVNIKTAAPISVSPVEPGSQSPNLSLASSSYEELVNKYCFFGSKPNSAPHVGTSPPAHSTGNNASSPVVSSSAGSPPHHAGPATHHALQLHDPNSYFSHLAVAQAQYASPLRQATSAASSQSTTPSTVPIMRAASPGFTMSAAEELPFDSATAQALPERFPWSGDAKSTPAITG